MRMPYSASFVTATLALFAPLELRAAEYYVSPTGSDSNSGTLAAPFATLAQGNSAAGAGDTVWLRGGTYYITSQVTLSKSGTSDTNRTRFWAYPGEVPIFDASRYVTSNAAVDVPVILVTGNWMHLKGFEVANAKVGASGDHSYSMVRTKNASNNIFELLNIHHGFGPGLFIDTGTGGNLILNCDSHDNYDVNGSQGDGQNGDGFGVHYQKTGPSTIIRGCRAWIDSDDGYDLIYQEVPVIIENSFAIQNGYANAGASSPSSGNGNGFKVGSSITGVRHIVRNNLAWKNKAAGFYANHSTGGNTWYNNTSYNNGTQYNMLASSFAADGTTVTGTIILSGALAHLMRNNVGFPNKNTNMGGVDTAFNTWDLGITEASSDFASTSDTGCTGPRQADGSMPAACTFMMLKSGSPLIDKGTDVGLAFDGNAPDLGAYEFGAAGGATSTGGAASTGGATSTSTGGKATGGATSAGGSTAAGAGAGGAVATGGEATGASSTAGGAGDAFPTGGTNATGGNSTSGGAGGAAATGGNSNLGGASTMGGASTDIGGQADVGGNATGGLANGSGGSTTIEDGGAATVGGNASSGGTTTTTTSTGIGTGGGVIGEPGGGGGCSCSVSGGTQTRYGVALWGLGLLAMMRRRRTC